MKAIITYLFQARHSKSSRDILELLPSEELRKEAMTIADRLEKKGRQAGKRDCMQEGKREGRVEGEQKVLERLLDQKFGLTEEERKLVRSQLDPERLDAALDAFVFVDSKANVLEHLGSAARPKPRPRQVE